MKTYSPERKAAVIAKMLPPHNQPIMPVITPGGDPDKNALPLAL